MQVMRFGGIGHRARPEFHVDELGTDADVLHQFDVGAFLQFQVLVLAEAGLGELREIADHLADVFGALFEVQAGPAGKAEQEALVNEALSLEG